MLPFARNLTRLGIDASVRLVDPSQYINRLRSFDFDMIVCGLAPVAIARATSSATTGLARRPTTRQPQLRRHRGPGGRRAGRAGDPCARPRKPGRAHPRARPRAALRLTTSSRTGTSASTASSTGTSSRGPDQRRRPALPSPTGGSTRPRRRRLEEARMATAAGDRAHGPHPAEVGRCAGSRPGRGGGRLLRVPRAPGRAPGTDDDSPTSSDGCCSWCRRSLGIMLINFVVIQVAPGGPVEQLDRPAHRRGRADHRARHAQRRRRAASAPAGPGRGRQEHATAARRAWIRSSSRSWRSASASIKPMLRALPADDAQLSCRSTSARASSAIAR